MSDESKFKQLLLEYSQTTYEGIRMTLDSTLGFMGDDLVFFKVYATSIGQ